ncbi:unnamed protein product [Adineta steineri]|uniref:RNA-dependent RNA polymerase n=3 Tax=Adineta steineri TaxID=433720 RepID=A0A813V1I5_9BILA|nr:unnamed protein product [Adineta steineri]
MSTEKVLCCFKNLNVDSRGSNILVKNLNNSFNTNTFDIIGTQEANDSKCELGCDLDEAQFIMRHLADLVTSNHRSIWFTYKTRPSDESTEINKFKFSHTQTQKSWTALYNFGSMISYDTFISHIHNNRSPVWVNIGKDTRGRPKSIVLQEKYSKYRMIFDFRMLHTDILVKYGQEEKNESIQIVFMLKVSPEIKQKLATGEYTRICDSSKHPMNIDTICQCSDLWLQFDRRTDAWEFLEPFPNFDKTEKFVINYADFQYVLSSNYKNLQSSLDIDSFSSELGSYGMTMLWSLGYVFRDKYLMDNELHTMFVSCYQESSEKFYDLCCTLWNSLQKDHCYSIRSIFNDPTLIRYTFDKNKHYVPHVIVTPLRVLYQPKHSTTPHRGMRQYNYEKQYQWMLVYIRDEDSLSQISNIRDNTELQDRYKKILQNGLCLESVLNKKLMCFYFGSSGSQMKKQQYWFLGCANANSDNAASKIDEARRGLGDLDKIKNVATYIARVGLYLSISKSTDIKLTFIKPYWPWSQLRVFFRRWMKLSTDQMEYRVELIEDIEHNGYTFTDGVGKISLGLAKKVALSIGIRIDKNEDIPSAYQVRIAGCKGMLSIDSESGMNDYYIKVRKSMMKFNNDDWTLHIVDHSRLMCLSLNNQIIRLLYDLNKENKAVIESLQNRCTLQGQWHPPEENYYNIFDSENTDRIKDANRRQGYINAKDLLRRNKIPLPVDEARCLFGIADETRSLKEGQCFIQYQTMDRKSYKIVTGEVLVTKNPCLYAGDIRRLKAVDIPRLRPFIRDCIVFPVLGSRPHCNEISGSDLDGDLYWVYWGTDLIVKNIIPPLAYTAASKKTVPEVTPELIINHILNTMDDQTSGIICSTHSVIADKDPDGTKSKDCKYLAKLFPRAIDSVKTGEEINMEMVKELREKWCGSYPTWMMKEDKSIYKSESINGYLFNKAQDLTINRRDYNFMHVKYDKMNQDTRIKIQTEDDKRQLFGNRKRCGLSIQLIRIPRYLNSLKHMSLSRKKYRILLFTCLLTVIIICCVLFQ